MYLIKEIPGMTATPGPSQTKLTDVVSELNFTCVYMYKTLKYDIVFSHTE